jgi:5-methylcytosine-specific restriction endonuclease McrA
MLDIDHVKTFASGGSDDAFNCMTLCRFCHIEKGSTGLVSFSKKNSNVHNWLIKNGWELVSGKWRHF